MEQNERNEQTPPEQATCNVCGTAKHPGAEGWDGDTCPACAQGLRLTAALNPGMVQVNPDRSVKII